MKTHRCQLAVALFMALALNGLAATRYVDLKCVSPTSPYTSWATAATNIQVAIDAAASGDTILVTNGLYATGGKAVYGTTTNRVAITKRVALRSVNGPQYTIIQGRQLPGTNNGDGAIRCVYLTAGASLSGFTLTNGATRSAGDYANERCGGGLWCDTSNPAVTNCVVIGNTATGNGGGSFYGAFYNCTLAQNWTTGSGGGASGAALYNCLISSNAAAVGGGVHSSTGPGQIYSAVLKNCMLIGNVSSDSGGGANASALNNCVLSGNVALNQGGGAKGSALLNCTVTGNSASYGGGTSGGGSTNSIVFFNSAPKDGANYYGGSLDYCCATPLPASGAGNLSLDPQLASATHLSANSPCRGAALAGSALGTDIDGEPWASPHAIGCDEYHAGSVTGLLSVAVSAAYTTVSVGIGLDLVGAINGHAAASVWDFGDGSLASNQPLTSHAWSAPGDYAVVLWAFNESWPGGVIATTTVHVVTAPVHYVAADNSSPTSPYASWATAATNIQDAVDAATVPGAVVLVTNGIYAAGGRAVYGTMTNRVAVTKLVVLRSVNGPETTIIRGYQLPGTTNGDGAIRCVYLGDGAFLSGFTLMSGATRRAGDAEHERNGGGLWCETPSAVASNCVIVGNSAANYGAGAYAATMIHCTLTGNSGAFSGGGANQASLSFCTLRGNRASLGGGAGASTLNNCTLEDNSAESNGGGAYEADLNNCYLARNSADKYGGGAYGGTLNHCTVTDNAGWQSGGGTYGTFLTNSIVCFNHAPGWENYWENSSADSVNYCCTTPLPAGGTGNISADPQLAGGPHLSAGSPCRGLGNAAYSTGTDIDGEPWAARPSIGCDEPSTGAATGPLSVAITAPFTNAAVGWPLAVLAQIGGWASSSAWDFGDGTVASNQPYASHAWMAAGDYYVVFRAYNDSNPSGVTAAVTVHVLPRLVHYVAAGNSETAAPYVTWATAAPDIQSAVDVAVPGALILVTNGNYATGGRDVFGTTSNRVVVDKPLLIQSVNGPTVTTIRGYQVPDTTIGPRAIRCAYLAAGASLSGFTLAGGAAWISAGAPSQVGGGGVWCESTSSVVSNCVLTGNAAYTYGGGAFGGTLIDSALTANTSQFAYGGDGGGASFSTLNNCSLTANSASYGGGAYGSIFNNCSLTGNSAGYGGGAHSSTLNNCTLVSNVQGGTYSCTLNNCTIIGNSCSTSGGGVLGSTLRNCIVSSNSATYNGGGAYRGTLNGCILKGNSAQSGGGRIVAH